MRKLLLAAVVVLNIFFHNSHIEKELSLWFKERASILRRHYHA
jgi:hypothetical protein